MKVVVVVATLVYAMAIADIVECGSRESSEIVQKETNADPAKAPEICTKEESDGVLVAHENCNKFYKCFNKKPVALKCPSNLLYNPNKYFCDWPDNVVCGDRTISDTNHNDNGNTNDVGDNDKKDDGDYNPAEAPAICARQGSDGVLVAHEYCNKFYKCFNTIPVALNCPLNLLYNPQNEQCDWPENVDCGTRTIP